MADTARQLDEVTALRFARADLLDALDRSTDGWDWLPEFGPGHRLTPDGVIVAGFHLFADLDDQDLPLFRRRGSARQSLSARAFQGSGAGR